MRVFVGPCVCVCVCVGEGYVCDIVCGCPRRANLTDDDDDDENDGNFTEDGFQISYRLWRCTCVCRFVNKCENYYLFFSSGLQSFRGFETSITSTNHEERGGGTAADR